MGGTNDIWLGLSVSRRLLRVAILSSLMAHCSQVSRTSYLAVVYPQKMCSKKWEAKVSHTLNARTGADTALLKHSIFIHLWSYAISTSHNFKIRLPFLKFPQFHYIMISNSIFDSQFLSFKSAPDKNKTLLGTITWIWIQINILLI